MRFLTQVTVASFKFSLFFQPVSSFVELFHRFPILSFIFASLQPSVTSYLSLSRAFQLSPASFFVFLYFLSSLFAPSLLPYTVLTRLLIPCGAQTVYMSVCAPVHGQISLSSELQPGSLPPDADADESSSDMLVIVDDPVSSAPASRATNSPASVSGSVSDNMNGEEKHQ